MSDTDDELIEALMELKNKKDALESRLVYLEGKEDFLQGTLLDPIVASRRANTRKEDIPGRTTPCPTTRKIQSYLHELLKTTLKFVRYERTNIDTYVKTRIEESLNKAITWASSVNPKEEDNILRKLLEQSLLGALYWLKTIDTTEKDNVFKEQLVDSLKVAVDWTSKSGGDDEVLVQALAGYVVVVSMWKEEQEKSEEDTGEADEIVSYNQDWRVDELDQIDRERIYRQELNKSLEDIFNFVRSIPADPGEMGIQHQLLETLVMAINWGRTEANAHHNEVMKQLLLETLVISLNWVMSVYEEEVQDIKKELIDSLIFSIDWLTSEDCRGCDEVMITLLKRSLRSAIELEKLI